MAFILEDEFGDIIAKARRGLGLTVGRVAAKSGVMAKDISQMENYTRKPSREEVDEIASTLQLDSNKLNAIATESWSPNAIATKYDPALEIITITAKVGGYPVHAYLLICAETREAAIIDTAANPKAIMERINKINIDPKLILLTHAHGDHANGLQDLEDAFSCPTLIHANEPKPRSKNDLKLLKHGDAVSVGNLKITTLDTPGHTAGGCSFYVRSTVIVGDALFAGSVGNASISYENLLSNVQENLLSLPEHTVLFPGHGPATTVEEEINHNPFF